MIDQRRQPVARDSAPPAPAGRRERIPLQGLSLSVLRWDGERIPFVLVHGLASNARLWDGVAAHLAAAGHAVVAMDQRGHGESDRPATGYGFGAVAADLADLVERLALDRPVLVGQSWGADVVLEAAIRYPSLSRGIACVDGALADLGDRFETWEACWERLAPPRLAGVSLEEVRGHMARAHPDWPAWGIEAVLAGFEPLPDGSASIRLSRDRHAEILRALWEHRPSELYRSLTVPALLLPADTGEPDWTADKRRAVAAIEASCPLVSVRWFSPADHDVQVQQAPAVAAALLGWLYGVVAA